LTKYHHHHHHHYHHHLSGLNHPEKFLGPKEIPATSVVTQSTINIPDACILTEMVVDLASSEPATDWFKHFQKNCDDWNIVFVEKEEGSSSSRDKGGKEGIIGVRRISNERRANRKKEEEEVSSETEVEIIAPQKAKIDHRVRFLRTMKDLEMSGIVKIKSQGTVILRQAYIWLSNDN
jgi:hypothetical protein